MTAKLIILACLLVGSQAREAKISGGSDVESGEFPHQVSIEMHAPPDIVNGHFCGGSIINERWILTNANCISTYLVRNYYSAGIKLIVRAGKYDLNATEESEQISTNALPYWVYVPQNYKKFKNRLGIALIKLETPFHFNKYVAPIKLPKKDSEPTGKLITSGWGAIGDRPDTNTEIQYPTTLQKAEVQIIDRTTCIKPFQLDDRLFNEELIDETNICTRHLRGGWGDCEGDPGGPLISKGEDGNVELVGVVAFTVKSCWRIKDSPLVYAKVSPLVDWIENTIAENSK